jgi:endonuclease/exonuclease/phosphatase family metal-dependent hydrolase
LWHMSKRPELKRELWTTEYPDLIVQNLQKHKGWLDHILVSPNMIRPGGAAHLVPESGRVAEKTDDARVASDHFMVYCDIDW